MNKIVEVEDINNKSELWIVVNHIESMSFKSHNDRICIVRMISGDLHEVNIEHGNKLLTAIRIP